MSDENAPLLFDRMTVEWATAHASHVSVVELLKRYRKALHGIASCGTACGCCRMHQQVAAEALFPGMP